MIVICISGFEHCGISLSRITRPTLHYDIHNRYLTRADAFATPYALRLGRSFSQTTLVKPLVSAEARPSSVRLYRQHHSVLVSKGPVRDPYPLIANLATAFSFALALSISALEYTFLFPLN